MVAEKRISSKPQHPPADPALPDKEAGGRRRWIEEEAEVTCRARQERKPVPNFVENLSAFLLPSCPGPRLSHLLPAGKLSLVRVREAHITRLSNNTGKVGSAPVGGPHSFVDLSQQHF